MCTLRAFVFAVVALAVSQAADTSLPPQSETEINRDASDRVDGCYIPDYENIKAFLGKAYADAQVKSGHLKKPKFETEEMPSMEKYLWRHQKENGLFVIPYEFVDSFSQSDTKTILGAVFELADTSGVVTFRQKRVGDEFWIRFTNDPAEGCSSLIGKALKHKGKGQYLNLKSGCVYKGIIQHELLHALGFYHEHSRPGRDKFVEIQWNNIEKGKEDDFKEADSKYTTTLGAPYDYDSIMHYKATEFSRNFGKTIESYGHEIGQRKGLSKIDIQQLRLAYQCDSGVRNLDEYLAQPCTSDCKCSVGTDMLGCKSDGDCHGEDIVCRQNQCVVDTSCGKGFVQKGPGWCSPNQGKWQVPLTNEECKAECDRDSKCRAWSRSEKEGCSLYPLWPRRSSGKQSSGDAYHYCHRKAGGTAGKGWCRPYIGFKRRAPGHTKCEDACNQSDNCLSFSSYQQCTLYPKIAHSSHQSKRPWWKLWGHKPSTDLCYYKAIAKAKKGDGWCHTTKKYQEVGLNSEQCKRNCNRDRSCGGWSRSEKNGCILYTAIPTHSTGVPSDPGHKCYNKGGLYLGKGECAGYPQWLKISSKLAKPSSRDCETLCLESDRCKSFIRGHAGKCILFDGKVAKTAITSQDCWYKR